MNDPLKLAVDFNPVDYGMITSTFNEVMSSYDPNPIRAIAETEASRYGLNLDRFNRLSFYYDKPNAIAKSGHMLCILGGERFTIKAWDDCWPELAALDISNARSLREAIRAVEEKISEVEDGPVEVKLTDKSISSGTSIEEIQIQLNTKLFEINQLFEQAKATLKGTS